MRVSCPFGARLQREGRVHGFTLVELVVVIAVLAILAAVATPNLIALINSNRLAGMTGQVTSSIQLARSEAIRRNARVTVCGSADGSSCGGGDWNHWIVVGQDNVTGENDVIREEVAAGAVELSGPVSGIQFNPAGLADGEETVTVCIPTDRPEENQRVVRVMISGNIITSKNNGGGGCP